MVALVILSLHPVDDLRVISKLGTEVAHTVSMLINPFLNIHKIVDFVLDYWIQQWMRLGGAHKWGLVQFDRDHVLIIRPIVL